MKVALQAFLRCALFANLLFRSLSLSPSVPMVLSKLGNRVRTVMNCDDNDDLGRRKTLVTCTSIFGSLVQSPTARASEFGSLGLSPNEVAARLSTVPFFSITTKDGDVPYFTKKAKNGTPISVFFAQRSDAEALLPEIRKSTDPEAVVTPVNLDTCWALVSNPDEKSNGGLFVLQANRRQIVNANGNTGADLKLDVDNKIPLFFDRRVALNPASSSDAGGFPFFFKLEDLEMVYNKGLDAMPDDAARKASGRVKVEISTLDSVVAAMFEGSVANADKILLVSSESF